MHAHPATDATAVLDAFLAVATGTHDGAKRESGVTITRYDLRQLRAFAEEGHGLPAGALAMEAHLGYRYCGIAGTEPPEIVSLYSEIRSHAGTVSFHEQQLKERGEALLFEGRRLVEEVGELLTALDAGVPSDADKLGFVRLLTGTQDRAARESQRALDAGRGLRTFSTHSIDSLGSRLDEKIEGLTGTRHDTEVFGQRAKLRRLLAAIRDTHRAFLRAADTDELNLLGKRLDRTVYGAITVDAQDAAADAVHQYKKLIGQVAIPHRLLKSLGHRRASLGTAALVSRNAAQAAEHLATVWNATAAALQEGVTALDSGKTPADFKKVADALRPLAGSWAKVAPISEVNDDVFG